MNNKHKIILCIVVIIIVIMVILLSVRPKRTKNDKSVYFNKTINIPIFALAHKRTFPSHDKDYKQKIPKIIMQTNERSEVPINMAAAIKTVLDDNSEYEYRYFDNKASRKYLKKEFGSRYLNAYDDLIPGAYKADFFRYCFLYRTGGVYLDTGMVSNKSLRNVIRPEDEFISPEDNGCGGIYNAFMCAVPNHPILKIAVETCLHNIERKFMGKNILEITGPDMLSTAFENVVGKEINPNMSYPHSIRLLYYRSPESKRAKIMKNKGEVFSDGSICLYAKYKGYGDDMKWYHTNKHYSLLWKRGEVYHSVVSNNGKSNSLIPDYLYIVRYELRRQLSKHKRINR